MMLFQLITYWPRLGNVPWAALPFGLMMLCSLDLNPAVDASVPKYRLTDQLGRETSFPYKGGHVKVICEDGQGDVYNDTAGTKKGQRVIMKNDEFELKPGEIGTIYGCEVQASKFTIGLLHCDPFDMIPSEKCNEKQWCLIAKDGHAVCEDKAFAACFLRKPTAVEDKFESSQLKFRYACTEKKKQSNHEFGSCHAKSEGKKIVGISDQSAGCGFLEPLTVNNAAIAHEETFSISVTEKKWKIQFKGVGDVTCTILDNDNKSYASIKPFKTDTIVQPEFDGMLLPRKLKFSCLKSASSYSNLIAGFALIFDPDPSKYKISISKTLKPTFLELTCSCNVPDGLIGKLTWEKPEISKGLMEFPSKLQNKQLNRKEHASPVEYNCYLQVLAYAYPNTFKLIRLPLDTEHLQASITIAAKDFVTDTGVLKPGGGSNGSGTGENPTENKNKDANSTEKDKDKTKTIVIVSCVVALLVTIAIVCVIIFVVKQRKAKQLKYQQEADAAAKASAAAREEAEVKAAEALAKATEAKEIAMAKEAKEKQAGEERMAKLKFINSIENSKNNVDEPFLALFLRQKNRIFKEAGGDVDKVLGVVKAMPKFCKVAGHYDVMNNHVPTNEARTLATCRFPGCKFEQFSWVFKPEATVPRKSKCFDSVEKPAMNMSYVTDIFLEDKYIASQAPLEEEIELFLKTIVHQRVSLLVALVATNETRWHNYMDIDINEFKMYGNYKLTCRSYIPTQHFDNKSMEIMQGDTKHLVTFVRYLSWVDFTAGEVDDILRLRSAMIRLQKERPGRTLIHCAAGLGRTGCLLGCLLCLQYYDYKGLPMDISAICLKVRKERIGAIQNPAQFVTVYWVVAAYATAKLRQLLPQDQTLRPTTLRPKLQTDPTTRKDSKKLGTPAAKSKNLSAASSIKKITATTKSRATK